MDFVKKREIVDFSSDFDCDIGRKTVIETTKHKLKLTKFNQFIRTPETDGKKANKIDKRIEQYSGESVSDCNVL